jgi:hypothetical protein
MAAARARQRCAAKIVSYEHGRGEKEWSSPCRLMEALWVIGSAEVERIEAAELRGSEEDDDGVTALQGSSAPTGCSDGRGGPRRGRRTRRGRVEGTVAAVVQQGGDTVARARLGGCSRARERREWAAGAPRSSRGATLSPRLTCPVAVASCGRCDVSSAMAAVTRRGGSR